LDQIRAAAKSSSADDDLAKSAFFRQVVNTGVPASTGMAAPSIILTMPWLGAVARTQRWRHRLPISEIMLGIEQQSDKARLDQLREALNGAFRSLGRDECGTWRSNEKL
jgi:hypothetical protein